MPSQLPDHSEMAGKGSQPTFGHCTQNIDRRKKGGKIGKVLPTAYRARRCECRLGAPIT